MMHLSINLSTGKVVSKLMGHSKKVNSVSFHPSALQYRCVIGVDPCQLIQWMRIFDFYFTVMIVMMMIMMMIVVIVISDDDDVNNI